MLKRYTAILGGVDDEERQLLWDRIKRLQRSLAS
jgi:hypothetical protein